VVAVAEAAGDAAVEFDQAVDGFGAAVVRAAGVEVGQERCAPLLQRLPEPSDLRDRTGRQRGEDLLDDQSAFDRVLGLVGRAKLLGTLPGDEHFVVTFVSGDRAVEPCSLSLGELLGPASEDGADPVQRVARAAAVAVDLLLDPAADLVDCLGCRA
jgi:hypothetical protein